MTHRRLFPLALSLMFFGCILSIPLGIPFSSGAFAIWRPLGAPPAAALSIAGLDFDYPLDTDQVNVYVQTDSGVYYRHNTRLAPWAQVAPPDIVTGIWHTCSALNQPEWSTATYPYLDRLPGKIKDCAEIQYSWEVFSDEMIVALLEDGSLWWYHYHTDLGTLLAVPFGCILAGLAVALLVHFRPWKKS